MNRGKIIIISGPSGVGKGTICRRLKSEDGISVSVSVTEREPRPGEMDGVHYYFVSRGKFQDMIKNDELIEWAQYGENHYGTPRSEVLKLLSQGKNVILEIDVQGAMQIKEREDDVITIFVVPPDMETLKKRLLGRGTESSEQQELRLNRAIEEMQYEDKYDFSVVNDSLEQAVIAIKKIIEGVGKND